ncbi:MAG: hypothetical protein COV37_16360 [Bdellovibrio sp. CG11_big_fil_rev_8_21_14_0_20_39_38]|nr:MAG: hypothetical protein COW78_02865 [Bdellovibrio sp. CG22_combo_CG10-13_8_21_14_all_39_27]PIR33423.1 MAG: hypothetical protein COV37_16360 [Bdellovibrio sp. CG11_big_fil_rev_8_21_14_0_20_39_38]
MTFYILLNQLTTLFVSLNLLTTLTFDSEIQSYLYGGSKEEMFFQVTNNHRTLAIKPLIKEKLSNLLIITKERKYYFDLGLDESHPHQFIEVKDGMPSHALKKKITTSDFEILEGEASMLFINRKDQEAVVNGQKVKYREYLSKGVPIIYEGKRILN